MLKWLQHQDCHAGKPWIGHCLLPGQEAVSIRAPRPSAAAVIMTGGSLLKAALPWMPECMPDLDILSIR